MEKLIELLNEYENRDEDQQIEWRIWEWDKWEKGKVRGIVNEVYMWWVSELVVCSVYYWFIKWLVENDKIDLWEKLFNLTKNDNKKSIICDLDNNDFSWEDTFLMLLAISNSPIEDLISYLK